MLDADKREALRQAKARIAEIMAPTREKNRQARKAQRKAIGAARKAAPMKNQRQPRVRNNAYLQWLRRQPCLVCWIEQTAQQSRTQACHIRAGYIERGWRHTGKAERPDDVRAWPGCEEHHLTGPNAQHKANETLWWTALGIYPPDLCDDLVFAFANGGSAEHVFDKYAQRQPVPGGRAEGVGAATNPSGTPQ